MDRLEMLQILGRYIQTKVLSGKPMVTIRELWELVKGGLSRDSIGWWLRQQGFEKASRRIKEGKRSREWFLTQEGIEKVKKGNRRGFRCYNVEHTDKKGKRIDFYYDLLPDEELVDNGSMVVKITDKNNWKIAYCPLCNLEDHRVYLNVTLDPKKIKKPVVFEARGVSPRGDLIEGGEGYRGPGMLDTPDNLKGQW